MTDEQDPQEIEGEATAGHGTFDLPRELPGDYWLGPAEEGQRPHRQAHDDVGRGEEEQTQMKIISLTTGMYSEYIDADDEERQFHALYALCDDGSVWCKLFGHEWYQVDGIKDASVAKEKAA